MLLRQVAAAAVGHPPRRAAIACGRMLHSGSNAPRHGFRLFKTTAIDDLRLRVNQLRHGPSGAELWHLERDDPCLTFAVGFRTPPSDSTGVPHILEHTALCGSTRFPVRDPFFKMLNRSLATYMNAFTADDYTLYPFSTLDRTDFGNLLSVYLDAVFRPLLEKHDFSQEGWRLEHADVNSKDSPIVFKGVVHSEMKGVMSDTSNLFLYKLQRHLYPGCVYSHNSGGDPNEIPRLSWTDLVNYHRTQYRPDCARFFVYGPSADLEAVALPIISEALANHQSKTKIPRQDGIVDIPKRLSEPLTVEEACPFDPSGDQERQTRMCLAFCANDIRDAATTFNMNTLSELLLDGSSSPMHRALIDSGMAPDYSPGTGYDPSTRIASFKIGVQGIAQARVAESEAVIWDVLRKSAESPANQGGNEESVFSTARVEASLHQTEMALKHATASFGMSTVQAAARSVFHGGDPAASLQIGQHLRALRADTGVLQRLLKKHVLENKHHVRLVMRPDPEFAAIAASREATLLEETIARLDAGSREAVYEEGKQLAERQDAKQDLSVLPCLSLDQVSPNSRAYPLMRHAEAPSVLIRPTCTNGLTYIRCSSTMPASLPADLLVYLPLFTGAMKWQGTKTLQADQLDQQVRAKTGGINISQDIVCDLDDPDHYRIVVEGNSSAFEGNVEAMALLVEESLFETDFKNRERLRTLIQMNISAITNSIAHSGHSFAQSLGKSLLRPGDAHLEAWNGLSQLVFLNRLAKKIAAPDTKVADTCTSDINGEDGMQNVEARLLALAAALRNAKHGFLVVTQSGGTVEQQAIDQALGMARRFPSGPKDGAAKLPTQPPAGLVSILSSPTSLSPSSSTSSASSETMQKQTADDRNSRPLARMVFVPTPFEVNYCATVLRTVAYRHPQSIALQVGARLMKQHYLHKEIREKGGAYGASAAADACGGTLSFTSYRDPQHESTITCFHACVQWLAGAQAGSEDALNKQSMLEAKLGVLAGMDAPVDPCDEGTGEAELGITHADRQARRDALIKLTADDVVTAAKEILIPAYEARADVVLGRREDAAKFNARGWDIATVDI